SRNAGSPNPLPTIFGHRRRGGYLSRRALGTTDLSCSHGATASSPIKKETPQPWPRGFGVKTLAMTYSRMLSAHYHRRVRVSLPSSGWDRVVPHSYCHQGEGGGSRSRSTGP